ncbi:MAG TPA: ABC transporter permease [Luteitalea sp.]|nr:ABC transporter permease [Luteitalea sp.]
MSAVAKSAGPSRTQPPPAVARHVTVSIKDRAWTYAVAVFNVLCLLFLLTPIIVVIFTSFNDTSIVAFPPQSWGFSAYQQIPGSFFDNLRISVQLGLVSVVISVVCVVPLSFGLVRARFPGKSLVEQFFRSPLQIPAVVIGLSLFEFYVLLQGSGLSLRGSFIGLVIGHVIVVMPFMLAAVLPRVALLDPDMEKAAASLGAGPIYIARRITLPLLRPALIAGAFIGFVISFNEVAVSLFLVGPGTTTLPVAIFSDLSQDFAPWIFAMSTLIIVMCALVVLAVNRLVGLRSALSGDR